MGAWEVSPLGHILNGWSHPWSRIKTPLDTETFVVLLDAGFSIHALDNSQRSPLHWAAVVGRADIMTTLLERGTIVNAVDNKRRTPLHLTIVAGAVACARILLAAGADPNALHNAPVHDSISKQPLAKLELAIDNKPCQIPSNALGD